MIVPRSSIDETDNNDLTYESTSSANMNGTIDSTEGMLDRLNSNLVMNPTATTKKLSSKTNEDDEQPPAKTARFDNGAINKDWFDSMEKTIGDLTTNVMLRIKESNVKSLDYIGQLEQEIHRLKEESRLMKENVSRIVHQLEVKNIELRANAKICGDCSKPVNTILFCDASCQDNDYR